MSAEIYDIVIVGAGTAGMSCAIFAAQKGKRVAVLEKSDIVGGAMHWSGGHMSGAGTKRQKEKGIEDDSDTHYLDIMRINNGTGDLDLIRKAVDLNPAMIDWFQDQGFEFAPECPRIVYGHVPYEIARTHYGTDKAKSNLKTMMPHWQKGIEEKKIHLLLETTWTDLGETDGYFDTVICKDKEENILKIKGKNIVITTGGYGRNPKLFSKHHPEVPLVSAAYPMSTGEGFKILERAGAQFKWAENHLSSLGGIEIPPGSGYCDFHEGWANVLTSVYRQPRDIYVDQSGNRFMAEDEINPDTRERILLEKNIWHFWIVFDEPALMERDENGNENCIVIGWDSERIKKSAEEELFLFSASTIKKLAEKIHIPPNNLVKTIRDFNDFTEAESDPSFGRKYLKNKILQPPYYALKVHASVLVTFGGIMVNEALQILDAEGQIIPGMYAAGEVLGLGATSGGAFCSGMAITPALSFGRYLGENLT